MEDATATFSNDIVTVAGRSWAVPYPIIDLKQIEDRVFIIYDPSSGPGHGRFHNLEAFEVDGRRIWTAEQPVEEPSAVYLEFREGDGLWVWNFACYLCEIDPDTGRLLKARFTK